LQNQYLQQQNPYLNPPRNIQRYFKFHKPLNFGISMQKFRYNQSFQKKLIQNYLKQNLTTQNTRLLQNTKRRTYRSSQKLNFSRYREIKYKRKKFFKRKSTSQKFR
jgi:hypothetical protein